MAEDNLRLRPAGEEDSEAIRRVLAASFAGNAKVRPDLMAWQYWDNPFGPPVCWVAEADDLVVAHYSAIRYPGMLRGQPSPLGLGIDAATDPAFRGLGLFEQLARALFLGCGQAGLPVTCCLPNANSLRGLQKVGWQELAPTRVLVAPLDVEWLAGRFNLPAPLARAVRAGFRLPKGTEAEVVADLPAGLDDLWAEVAADHHSGVARAGAWWRWRYLDRPDNPYVLVESRRGGRLVGAAAALAREDLGGTFLCLLELMAIDTAAARSLVGRLVETAAGPMGAVGLATTALPSTPIYRLARAAGLRPLPRRFQPTPIHVGLVDNLNQIPGLAKSRWTMAWGDLDHI